MSGPSDTRRESDEVVFATGDIVRISASDVGGLKQGALSNGRRRIRLCTHGCVDDLVHEMVIVHTSDTYVRPHRHEGKAESLHVLEGRAALVFFDDVGEITEVTELGDYASGSCFYVRLNKPVYHTLLMASDVFVFHETTQGPFLPEATFWAPWAPDGSDPKVAAEYNDTLTRAVGELTGRDFGGAP